MKHKHTRHQRRSGRTAEACSGTSCLEGCFFRLPCTQVDMLQVDMCSVCDFSLNSNLEAPMRSCVRCGFGYVLCGRGGNIRCWCCEETSICGDFNPPFFCTDFKGPPARCRCRRWSWESMVGASVVRNALWVLKVFDF
jgi:hypothetical protein